MTLLRRILGSTGGKTAATLLVLYCAWQAWSYATAPGKIAPGVEERVAPDGAVNVLVELRFPPERFHTLELQRYGRVSGSEGDAVEVRRATMGGVRAVARRYWVRQIRPLE
jgi:hypothetical protein